MNHTVSPSPRILAKRNDALLALPLARFRRALADLSANELVALEARLAVQQVRSRWARGGSGIARHRVPGELGMLARRAAAVGRARELRLANTPMPIRLVAPETNVRVLAAPEWDKHAA
ncbi:MAG: hypothetical protein H0V00_13865 [Chloroflexia bacterium]|nr:hypothetical protein [Chloroflexia bacterium]